MIALMFGLNACKHKTVDPAAIRTVCFETEVFPIFQVNCAINGCHADNGGSEDREEEGFDLRTYSGIVENVSPGNPENSKLYKAITAKGEEIMPPKPSSPLTESQRTLIYIWILQGATRCDTTKIY